MLLPYLMKEKIHLENVLKWKQPQINLIFFVSCDLVWHYFCILLFWSVRISVNLRLNVYKYGMFYHGSDSDWENIWSKYKVEPSPQEKELLALSLSNTQKPHLLAKLVFYFRYSYRQMMI